MRRHQTAAADFDQKKKLKTPKTEKEQNKTQKNPSARCSVSFFFFFLVRRPHRSVKQKLGKNQQKKLGKKNTRDLRISSGPPVKPGNSETR